MSSFAYRCGWIALVLTFFAHPLSAQTFRVLPRVGVLANARDLPEFDPSLFQREEGNRSPRVALGLALEATVLHPSLAVRVGGAYAFESDLPVRGVVCIESPCASVRAGTLGLAGDLIGRLPVSRRLGTYLMGGVGLKRWLVDREVGIGSFVESETRLAGHLGAGLELAVGPGGVVLEVGDWITGGASENGPSIGDENVRHDVFVTVGVVLGR